MSEGLAAQLLGSGDASPTAQIPKNPFALSLPSSVSTQSPASLHGTSRSISAYIPHHRSLTSPLNMALVLMHA